MREGILTLTSFALNDGGRSKATRSILNNNAQFSFFTVILSA